MKLLTLNCHSLLEPEYEEKRYTFCSAVCMEQPHIVALQEVNQTGNAPCADPGELVKSGYVPCTYPEDPSAGQAVIPVKTDNHAFCTAKLLSCMGYPCTWTWVPAKIGYGKYDEGLALFSRYPVLDVCQFYITGIQDYGNWKTRKALGIRVKTPAGPQHFFSLHMGWWDDAEEPFARQWERLTKRIRKLPDGPVWLMGDFNAPAHDPDKGYAFVRSQGWQDTYEMATDRDSGVTVAQTIDGWRDAGDVAGMRIDYIFTDSPVMIRSSKVIFNGDFYPVVSDHFGVMTES